ncbi:winged helix DNA-binding domain-containing protein [Microbacterium invictum]|uniref:Winged helix DNA-binding domain-containing protein n=1 Tax=Microbacterium invictum TaxID=515415 RepID=A0ABZ0V7H8_9MICO|nr:winged helix DNA-binding domain-containing protein [Microbacterium invictum]WQB69552.1 winged helix DNA-binding domain-containing protein [Microbacterium invictum]
MDRPLGRRLTSHRLGAPARDAITAAEHMLAVQAQDFVGGRWALAVRTQGEPTLAALDGLFDAGLLIRSWTMRGTLHIVPAADLRWILRATGDRQLARATPVLRREGVDETVLEQAGVAARKALADARRMTRADLFAVWDAAGIPTTGQRGYHLLSALAVRGVLCLGPLQDRPSGAGREQTVVLVEDLDTASADPADPVVELVVRYLRGHGPATARDAAWWTGLSLTVVREAIGRAEGRVAVWRDGADPLYIDPDPPPSAPSPRVFALPPFDEYYLSYDDRSIACATAHLDRVGPSKNGMVRAVIVAGGRVAGLWVPARGAKGIELLDADLLTAAEARAAVDRFTAFRAA